MFDSIIEEAKSKFGLDGDSSGRLIAGLLGLIANPQEGGFGGFIDRFKNAGLGDIVNSWITAGDNTPLSNNETISALGENTISTFASDAGIGEEKATTALAGIIPMVVDKLTPDGEIPDDESLLSKIGGFLSDWGVTIGSLVAGGIGAAGVMASNVGNKVEDTAEAVYDKGRETVNAGMGGISNAAGSVSDRTSNVLKSVDNALDGDNGNSGSILKWLIPLLLLGLAIALAFMFCGRTPTTTVPANTNANRSGNTNTAAKPSVDSSFSIKADNGKYTVTGVVPDEATKKRIMDALTAQYPGAGALNFDGLKVDVNAKPFASGWWDNFAKILPNLKDWKTGSLAFAGNAITEAIGLPTAALDQLKSLFTGWTLPQSLAATADKKSLSEVLLPGGAKLQAYPGGIEDQMVKFIQSDEFKTVTPDQLKDKWFSFDDLNFVFGKTELTPESKRQLDNIVAILKAYPDVKLKIGGYTDKKGDDAANLKLSDSRAKAVQTALQKAGVGTQVPEAEGYGEKFATVDENATDEERKADRRTAIRLIK